MRPSGDLGMTRRVLITSQQTGHSGMFPRKAIVAIFRYSSTWKEINIILSDAAWPVSGLSLFAVHSTKSNSINMHTRLIPGERKHRRWRWRTGAQKETGFWWRYLHMLILWYEPTTCQEEPRLCSTCNTAGPSGWSWNMKDRHPWNGTERNILSPRKSCKTHSRTALREERTNLGNLDRKLHS